MFLWQKVRYFEAARTLNRQIVIKKFTQRINDMIFYTGSYTQQPSPAKNPGGAGISCFELDQASGHVKLHSHTEQRNPSYLTISRDRKFLYAVEELTEDHAPRVISYRIGQAGNLALVNSQPLTGDYACHLIIVKDLLLVANYMTGNALSFPILKDGSLSPCQQIIQHTGAGPNKARQERAHAHMVYPYQEDHLYIVDLGIDRAKAYQLNPETKKWKALPELDIPIDRGAGARHMEMDATQSHAYILSELSGEIFAFKKAGDGFERIQRISFVPKDYKGAFGGAAIRLHPYGNFLYASNRGSDSIAVFKIDEVSGMISLIANDSSGGKTPRDFNIDPSGKWLIAANQDSDTLVTFRIDQGTGILSLSSETPAGTPVNICWLS